MNNNVFVQIINKQRNNYSGVRLIAIVLLAIFAY